MQRLEQKKAILVRALVDEGWLDIATAIPPGVLLHDGLPLTVEMDL